MRVLMTADSVGGVWTYALELADALADLDIGSTLLVTGARLTPEQRAELRRSRIERCFAAEYALEWQQDWTSVSRSCEWVREIGDRVQPDLVHVNGFVHAALGWEQPVVVVAHSCVPSWFEAVRRQPAPLEWDRYRVEVARGLAAADVVVAPTRAMLDDLRRHHRVVGATRVVPNGIAPQGSLRAVVKRDVVLAAGRLWDEAKNVASLARVAPRLGCPVEVAGDLPAPPPANVRALGRLARAELRARMAEAAVFCAPARYEPFGLAPLEAAAAGCALVLGDIPSLREVWEDGALYAAPDDADSLVAALEEARARHRELGERARAGAERYTAARMAEQYAGIYRWLAAPAAVSA